LPGAGLGNGRQQRDAPTGGVACKSGVEPGAADRMECAALTVHFRMDGV